MAKYSDIKGFTVQTLSTDTIASAAAGGAWTSVASLSTSRIGGVGAGTSPAAIMAGGYLGPPGGSTVTETWNGSSWTEVNDMNTAYFYGQGFGTTSAMVLAGRDGPGSPSKPAATETWNGTSWSAPGANINTNRFLGGGAGTSTAGIVFGGQSPTTRANTESWNGSAWTEVNDLNTAKNNIGGGTGTYTAALSAGGDPFTTEQWDGSSWTEITDNNTQRKNAVKTGTTTDALMTGGYTPPGSYSAATESWDGSAWTEVSDIATARGYSGAGGSGYASSAAIIFGGSTSTAIVGNAEEWSAPATFNKITQGQLYFNSTTNTFKETISDVPGTSWSSGTNLNSTRTFNNAAGSIPSAITFGGSPAPTQAYAEQWNGSAWTEVADLNEGRVGGAGGGASGTDAIMAGGYELPNVGNSVNTEIWDGSSWTEVNNLNAQKYTAGSAIPVSTSGFAFGGNPSVATAEVWDGTNWTEVSDLNTARMYLAGFGSATSAIAGNGIDPSASPPTYLQNKVEKWDGSSWTEVAEYNTARVENLQGQGSSNAAGIVAGGGTTGSNQIANTEIWNGTSWTELNDLATARRMGGNIGSTSNGMYVGGNSGPGSSTTVEHWESGLANKTITAS
jgi:hypothetical protein